MSKPRCIVPGRTYEITRRTSHRFFLLNPDRRRMVSQIYWYVTAVLASELGVELHAAQIMSNHMHEVLTDTRGELPSFLQQRNRLLANALKAHLGWQGEVFDGREPHYLELCGPEAILKAIGYVLANCVEAGLAENPEDWPGVTLAATDIGTRTIRADLPPVYFNPKSSRWPRSATIATTVPRALKDAFGDSARQRIVAAVETAVLAARENAMKAGRVLRSITDVFATKHTVRATAYEARGRRNPTFSAAGNREEAARALHERRTFYAAYRESLRQVREGVVGVLFPRGTWRLVRELAFGVSTT